MLSYLTRRLLTACLTLLLITFVVYGLIRAMPGTPVTGDISMLDPSKTISKADYERRLKSYGLDKPWYQAYFIWISNVAKGDLGRSISRKQPVTRLIGQRMWPTLMLSVISLSLAYLLSIPMGLYCTARANALEERSLSMMLYMLYSLPTLVAALYLQILLSVKLGWFPLFGMTSDDFETMSTMGRIVDVLWHATLPIICFTYGSLAFDTRFIKANMAEVIRQDYIRTAQAKGVSPRRVLVHHAFRNTLIPLVTMIGLTLPSLLGGSVILERIFTWPGMGSLFFDAIRERDYETIMGLTLMFSVLTLLGQLLADVLYAFVDPRVSFK